MVLIAVAALGLAMPAQAQFSDGFKFLEAVRKKEGDKVESALSTPGAISPGCSSCWGAGPT